MNPIEIDAGRRMRGWLWLAWLGVAAALAACGGSGGSAEPDTSLRVARQDVQSQSCAFDHVFVTVEKVRVRQRTAGADEEKGWTDITLHGPRRIDLLLLTGGLLQELGTARLPAGHYTGFRLVLASNSTTGAGSMANAVQPTGASLAELSTPGAGQGGLKLAAGFEVPAGQVADLSLADFDPCRSIVRAGNSGRFLLQPTIAVRASVVPANPERRLDGFISPLFGGGFAVQRRDLRGSVSAQRFDASGAAVGAEIRIVVNAVPDGSLVSITPLAGGGYVLTWLGPSPNPEQRFAADFPVIVQRYGADGTLLGSEQDAVSQPIALRIVPPSLPQTAALPGGGFVLAWGQQDPAGFNIYARRFAAGGTAAGTAQLVGAGGGELHVVAMAGGGFLVTWGVAPVMARAFGPDGAALRPVQTAGVRSVAGDQRTSVAALAGGGAVVAWVNDAGGEFANARRLADDGTPVGDAVRVDGSTLLEPGIAPQQAPSAAALADGGYVVAWLGPAGVIHGRRFAADGSPLGGVTRINAAASTFSGPTAVAIGNGFVVTWAADGAGGSFARFFDADGLLAV